jgi:hypothetical protein
LFVRSSLAGSAVQAVAKEPVLLSALIRIKLVRGCSCGLLALMVQLISPRQAYGMKGNAEKDGWKEQQSVSADSIDWLMRGAESSPDETMVRYELSTSCSDSFLVEFAATC